MRAVADVDRYRVALLDWLACAVAGRAEPAARAARAAGTASLERVTWAGCAGHVLDYDDTYSPGSCTRARRWRRWRCCSART